MLVGVWYVGVFLDALHRFLNNRNRPERTVSADEE